MSSSALRIVTAADSLPVTVAEAKGQLRITHAFEDSEIARIVRAASRWAEETTRRIFVTTEVELRIDRFPYRNEYCGFYWSDNYDLRPNYGYSRTKDRTARDSQIKLPGGLITAVESIAYIDTASVVQTLSGPTSTVPGTDYQEDLTDADEAFVFPAAGADWPSTLDDTINAVTLTYSVGYGSTPEDVPEDIRQAILFRVSDMFTNRNGSKGDGTIAAENLLEPHRVFIV